MSRKITISKYEGNTVYSVNVFDSFNQEHHLGYYSVLTPQNEYEIEAKAEIIWANEVKRETSSMDKAIMECIQMDIDRGVEPSLD